MRDSALLTTRPPVQPSGSNRFSRSWLFGDVVPRIYLLTTTVFKFWDWRLKSRPPQKPGCLTRCRVTRRILKQIHIFLQNSRRCPLCTSAKRCYSCWKHRWNILSGSPRTTSLVTVMSSSAEWSLCLRRSAFMRGKRQNISCCEIRRFVKTVTCYLVSSSLTRTERCVGALSCSSSQFFLRQSSGRLRWIESHKPMIFLQRVLFTVVPSGMNSMWTFSFESTNNSSITLHFYLSCRGFFLSWQYRRGVFQVVDRIGNTMFRPQIWSCWETSDQRQHYCSGHHISSCDHHVGLTSGFVAHCAG